MVVCFNCLILVYFGNNFSGFGGFGGVGYGSGGGDSYYLSSFNMFKDRLIYNLLEDLIKFVGGG